MNQRSSLHLIYILPLIVFLSSCSSSRTVSSHLYDPNEVAQLSEKLGVELSNLDRNDDKYMSLYAETSLWLGVPYRYGGMSRKGVDCSGFAGMVYEKVYSRKIPRSTNELSKAKYKTISKSALETGDLVFFATSGNKSKITHVGIYLKNGKFVHASTKRGVVVSDLDEKYYKDRWIKAMRVM